MIPDFRLGLLSSEFTEEKEKEYQKPETCNKDKDKAKIDSVQERRIVELKKDIKLVSEMKKMFLYLQASDRQSYNPEGFLKCLPDAIDISQQQDADEFYSVRGTSLSETDVH